MPANENNKISAGSGGAGGSDAPPPATVGFANLSPMRAIIELAVAQLRHGRKWMRQGKVDRPVIESLAVSLRELGQQVPIVTYGDEVIDGNCRLLAAPLVPLTHLKAIVLDHEPSELELLEIQYAIDGRRTQVPFTQKAMTLAAIQDLRGCTVTALAARTGDSQPLTTKLLKVHRNASEETKALLDAGSIDLEKAYMLCDAPDPDLVRAAPNLTREQLRRALRAKDAAAPEKKVDMARFAMPGGMVLTLKGPGLTLACCIEVLAETLRFLKKGLAQGLDITTQQKVMADTAKPHK